MPGQCRRVDPGTEFRALPLLASTPRDGSGSGKGDDGPILAGSGAFSTRYLRSAPPGFWSSRVSPLCRLDAAACAGRVGRSALLRGIYATDTGEKFAVRGAYRGDPIEADDLPPYLAKAAVAIEDRRFYEHGGIDLRGIARAAFNNVIGSEVEGGSTITQQFARLRYLSPERSLRRKVQEAMIAVWLETRLSKDEILARYLNSAYFGAGAVGADAASRRYFGKP